MDVDTAIEIHLTSNQMLAESGEFDLLSGNIASLLVSLIRCLECAADSIEELSTPEVAQRLNFVSGNNCRIRSSATIAQQVYSIEESTSLRIT